MDDKQARRIEVLLKWRDLAVARGAAVPTEADTMAIGASGTLFPDGIDIARAEPWRPTFAHLFKLLRRADLADPVSMLPEDLWEPAPVVGAGARSGRGAPGPAADRPPGPADPLLDALLAWYRTEPPDGPRRLGVTPGTLERIARGAARGRRSVQDVVRHLPADQADLADEIAAVVATRSPVDGAHARPRGAAQRPEHPSDRPRGATAPPPSGPGATPQAPTSPQRPFDDLDLAPGEPGAVTGAVARIEVKQADGGYRLRWGAAPAAPTVIYRVVAADSVYAAEVPQQAEELARTAERECTDRTPFRWVVRHLQVWYHAGDTPAEAAETPPVLLAQGTVVAHLEQPRITLDGRRVVGRWTAPGGAQRVRIERARRVPGELQPSFLEIRPADRNATGFTDADIEEGERYIYRISVEAGVDGATRQSAAHVRGVEIPVSLTPVTDLRITRRSPDSVDLAWTAPHHSLRVEIYRTVAAPDSAAAVGHIPVENLPKLRLAESDMLHNEVVPRPDGTMGMAGVAWPPGGSAHAYFTAVTFSGPLATAAPPRLEVNLPAVAQHRIVQRVFKQVLTFAWPTGAHSVAYRTMTPAEFEKCSEDPFEVLRKSDYISRGDYAQDGGTVLRLPTEGCVVVMAPASHHDRKRHLGELSHVRYPGLIRLKYGLAVSRDDRGAPDEVYLAVVAEQPGRSDLHFTLLHHPDRLPLHLNDRGCSTIEMRTTAPEGGEPATHFRAGTLPTLDDPDPTRWVGSVAGRRGFLRLFVNPAGASVPVALLDPPLARLRLEPPPGRVDPR